MVSWWVPHLPKDCRPDFNNDLGGDSNSGPVLAPGVYLSPTRITVPQATPILCQMKSTYLSKSPFMISWWFIHNDVVNKLDSGAPARNTGHVDLVGSVNAIRLSKY